MYVGDTTASEVVAKGNESSAQHIADSVAQWSSQKLNRVKLNSDKCIELRISFAKDEPQFAPIVVDNQELDRVNSAKLFDVTISYTLTWNDHVSEIIKKAAKRLYFLVQLKTTRVPRQDMVLFYTACIWSVLMYASPVVFNALPKYLKNQVERVEKRALSIICLGLSYNDAIELLNIVPITVFIAAI